VSKEYQLLQATDSTMKGELAHLMLPFAMQLSTTAAKSGVQVRCSGQ